jgi:hypothetical protein
MANRDNKGRFIKGHKGLTKKGKRPNFHGNSGSFKKGFTPFNKGTKGLMKPNKTSFKKGIIPHNKGNGNGNENDLFRHREDYKLWRKAIFTRDNFTCQKYGTKGGIIRAHHINNFSDFPELRLNLDNGITLSDVAHREFHKIYGKRNNTMEQLLEFINK